MTKLDYSIDSPEERKKLVEQILEEVPDPTPAYLTTLADYIIFCMEKQEKKERKILTDNRMMTVNKRETSFENLVSQFENGEDGIYNIITDEKTIIFQPKVKITKNDLEEIPELRQLREAIEFWEEKQKGASGRRAYIIKKTLIDLRRDQYIIKNAYRHPIVFNKITHSSFPTELESKEWINENGDVQYSGVSLINPRVCQVILCNYSRLKEDSEDQLDGDIKYLMEVFDAESEKALHKFPFYERLVEYKIDGLQNAEIQALLEGEFGIKHSVEYLSSLWRKKIPKMIAEQAETDFIDWYYSHVEKGTYKRCGRCGKMKLAHSKYFSRNKTSKDSFYSICKECRNEKFLALGQNLLIDIEDFSP